MIRKQEDLLSNYAGRHIRLLPTRTHSNDVYDRLGADVFVDGHNEAEMLQVEGFAKPYS